MSTQKGLEMTTVEREMIKELRSCQSIQGDFEKRFVSTLYYFSERDSQRELTDKQAQALRELHHKYRKQIAVLSRQRKEVS